MPDDRIGPVVPAQPRQLRRDRLAGADMIVGRRQGRMRGRRLADGIGDLPDSRALGLGPLRHQRHLAAIGDEARDQVSELTRS